VSYLVFEKQLKLEDNIIKLASINYSLFFSYEEYHTFLW